jgi:L-2-hydroxyglutarate oxidase LhgO
MIFAFKESKLAALRRLVNNLIYSKVPWLKSFDTNHLYQPIIEILIYPV